MSLYVSSVPQLTKMLRQLEKWLDKGVEYATAKKFEPAVLLQARLAPDMYPLTRQIQAACDAAKFAGARLSGREAPKNPDTETTVEELRTRIQSTVAFLETIGAKDFEGAEKRMVPLSFMPGKGMFGADYLVEMALPNFYFHLTTAYAILRNNGVDVGKIDFIGGITLQDL
jgi:hypothetical protein